MPVNIFGREYKTVAERLDELYKSGLEYSLNTELISWENGIVIMKATLQIGENTYTGHAYEVEGSSQINNTSALENCETSCIGRSLASAGMGGSEFASADELANALGQQQSSSTTAKTPQSQTSGNTTFSWSGKVGWSEESRTSTITFGKHKGTPWSDLSFNYVEWVATKSSLGDEFKNFASAELEHRNDALENLQKESVSKVVGVEDPVAYDKAVEKNRQEMVEKAKAKNRKEDKSLNSYAEEVVAKLEKKSDKDAKPTKKAKAPKKESQSQLSWDEIKETAKLLDD